MCEIFETLVDTGDGFAMAKEKLTEYFDPKKNVEYKNLHVLASLKEHRRVHECISLSFASIICYL